MSPWNSAGRIRRRSESTPVPPRARRRPFARPFTIGVLLPTVVPVAVLLLCALPADAQPGPDVPIVAYLETGPERRRGIDELAPDLTPHWYATYRAGDAVFEVRYSREPLDQASGWDRARCGLRTLRATAEGLYYYSDDSFSLLVSVSGGDPPPGVTVCTFVDRFVAEHLLFENLEDVRARGDGPMLPAVIEL
ncbi:MAG: hypothetical protein ACOC2Y_08475 [Spirochaetota bacterium]